jgi:hypothetical protein
MLKNRCQASGSEGRYLNLAVLFHFSVPEKATVELAGDMKLWVVIWQVAERSR